MNILPIVRAPFLLTLVLTLFAIPMGCSSPQLEGTKDVQYGEDGQDQDKPPVTQAELQEELQRFASEFIERITQSGEKLTQVEDPKIRSMAMRHVLRYSSSALDIATGPYPEVNLLDMMTFVRLNREVLEDYWAPKVYGQRAAGLIAAFSKSEEDLISIADTVSTKAQQQRLDLFIESWRQENPQQIYVEWVRLSDFSRKAGQLEKSRAEATHGLLSSLKGAVVTADQALLLANRAMFLGQRMPFLLRLQTRVGAQEILSDTAYQLEHAGALVGDLGPLVQDMGILTSRLSDVLERSGPLMTEYRQNLPRDLARGERITNNLVKIISSLEKMTWATTWILLFIGGAWIAMGWGGYYLAKRSLVKFEREKPSSRQPPSQAA